MEPACLFCEIAAGRREAAGVFEHEALIAFLDHRPVFPGHVLVVPRQHCATLSDLPSSLIGPLFSSVQLLASAVEQAMGARGTFIGVNNRVSQSVPHLHVHVVPRNPGDGLKGFFWPRRPYASPRHAADAQQAIRQAIVALRR